MKRRRLSETPLVQVRPEPVDIRELRKVPAGVLQANTQERVATCRCTLQGWMNDAVKQLEESGNFGLRLLAERVLPDLGLWNLAEGRVLRAEVFCDRYVF